MNPLGKIGSVTCSTIRENEVSGIFVISLLAIKIKPCGIYRAFRSSLAPRSPTAKRLSSHLQLHNRTWLRDYFHCARTK